MDNFRNGIITKNPSLSSYIASVKNKIKRSKKPHSASSRAITEIQPTNIFNLFMNVDILS